MVVGMLQCMAGGVLKEKTFRIAHMGDLTVEEVNWLLGEIEDIIG